MYKTGKLEVTSDVRAKPLGQKRKRGRPANLPLCLARSPPNKDTASSSEASAFSSEIPILVLSPSVPADISSPKPSQTPSIVSHLTPAPLVRSTRSKRRILDDNDAEPEKELPALRPAKRKQKFVEITQSKKPRTNDPVARITRSRKNCG